MTTKRGDYMRQAAGNIKLTEQQQAFADTLYSPSPFVVVLSEAEFFEKNWKKDILDFTKQEALTFLRSMHSLSLLTLMTYTSVTRSYANYLGLKETAWEEVRQADLIELIDVDELKNTYFTPEDVDKIEMIVPNAVDKFILRGFYEGLCGDYYEEFQSLTMDSFDKENLTVRLQTGKVKKVSQRLYDLALKSSTTYTYTAMDFRRTQVRKLIDMNGLVGEVVKTSMKVNSNPNLMSWKRKVRGRMESVKDFFELSYLTIPRLRKSAIYYNITTLAKEHNCEVSEAVYLPEFDDIIYQYDLDATRKDNLAYKYKNMSWADEK